MVSTDTITIIDFTIMISFGGGGGRGGTKWNTYMETCMFLCFYAFMYEIHMKAQKHGRFHVIYPFHHNGKGSIPI